MSRSGLLLALEQMDPLSRLPEVGQAARIVLELPQTAPERRCVECLGRVVRVDRDSPSVAFEFRRFQFTGAPRYADRPEKLFSRGVVSL